jgi:hypothetical protein
MVRVLILLLPWISRHLGVCADLPMEHASDFARQAQIPVAGQIGAVGIERQPESLVGRILAVGRGAPAILARHAWRHNNSPRFRGI